MTQENPPDLNNSKESMGQNAAKGVFWTGGGQMLRQIVQIITSIFLARLLAPEDFGLLSMAIVAVGINQLFADFGVGAAIVQFKKVNDLVLSSCFWLNVAIGILLTISLVILAPLIADFYENEAISELLMVLSLSLIITATLVVPQAILYKKMEFASVAKAQFFGSMAGASAAMLMAWNGYGVWSLVAQPLVGGVTNSLLTLYYSKWLPKLNYSWTSIKSLTHFSLAVLGSDLLIYAQRNGDDVIIGKFLGSGQLGYYSFAYQLMLYPLAQVSSVIVKVMFPMLSIMQDDLQRFRNAYLKTVSTIAILTFPMMLGLFVVSQEFVLTVFGEKWSPMVPILEVLSLIGMFQSISTTVGTIYLSTGNPKKAFKLSLVVAPLTIGAFVIGVNWGIFGVAVAYMCISVVTSYVSFWIAFRLIKLTFFEFHLSLIRPFSCAIIMAITVYLLKIWLLSFPSLSTLMTLIISILSGAVVYTIASLLINRTQIMDVYKLGKSVIVKKK